MYWSHRHGHQEGRCERDQIGHAKRREESALDPLQKEERQEDNADHERREDDRASNLFAGFKDDGAGRSPFCLRQ